VYVPIKCACPQGNDARTINVAVFLKRRKALAHILENGRILSQAAQNHLASLMQTFLK
jgi:hypothetical protein